MNSLVKIPIAFDSNLNANSTAALSVPYNISIENNIFTNFSTCGSILSNNFGWLSKAYFENMPNPSNLIPNYLNF